MRWKRSRTGFSLAVDRSSAPSHSTGQSVASELIGHNVKRKQKELYTENGEGAPVRLITYPRKTTKPRPSLLAWPRRSGRGGAGPVTMRSSIVSTR